MSSSPVPARLIFAGTPEFAARHLAALLDAGIRPVAVYSQPDRPAGRGQQLAASPVKQLALAHGIPVEQPLSLKNPEAQARLASYQPDLLIVVAYGLLLAQAVLDTPRLGCVNVHGSLLPRWRGAAPIQRALQAGDAETGVQLMQMAIGLDTGPVLAEARTPIHADDTGGSLHDRLAALGAAMLVEQLPALLAGELVPQPQDDALATYAHKLNKDEARIDWSRPADALARDIRAFDPWPVCWSPMTDADGQILAVKIWAAEPTCNAPSAAPGTVISRSNDAIEVACGEGTLRLQALQLPGGKRMDVKTLLSSPARAALLAVGRCFQPKEAKA